jgi:aspartate aminotransferase
MCGARIGCIVSKKQRANGHHEICTSAIEPPTFAQVASEAALDTPQSYFDNVISEYRERRDTLITELNKIEGVKVATQGGFYCIAELPIENADDFARWLLESYDLDGAVMVAPAAGFILRLVGMNQVRIAYVLRKKT